MQLGDLGTRSRELEEAAGAASGRLDELRRLLEEAGAREVGGWGSEGLRDSPSGDRKEYLYPAPTPQAKLLEEGDAERLLYEEALAGLRQEVEAAQEERYQMQVSNTPGCI